MSNRIVTGIAGLALAAFALGCAENDGPAAGVVVAPITITPASLGVDHGATDQLTAVGPNNTSPSVTWESENTAIATVDASGVVTGVSPGRTTVNARLTSDATIFRSASVTVNALQGTGLQDGVPLTGLSFPTDATPLYRIFVNTGATSLVVQISGGTGDADLYVRGPGTPPTFTTFACRPWLAGNNETCTINNPARGTWYIMLHAYDAFDDVSLVANVNP